MDIRQITVQYQREQDRILVRFQGPETLSYSMWLTRPLLLNWWPHLGSSVSMLNQNNAHTAQQPQGGDTSQLNVLAPETLARTQPLLVTELQTNHSAESTQLNIVFKEKLKELPTLEVHVNFTASLLNGLHHLLQMALEETDWQAKPHTAPEPAAEPEQTPPTSGYLH